jgi:hypothetical protein
VTQYSAHTWNTGDNITEALLNANEQGTAAAYDRGNHFGTQAAATITGLAPVATSGLFTDLLSVPSFAVVATSGAYADLTGRPSLALVATSGNWSDLLGRPTFATVATTGSYTDLANRPTLATVATTGSYNDLTNKPTIPGGVDYSTLPAGTTLTVLKSGSTWPARPTARTDIVVAWKGADPSPAIVASGTAGMLNNVDYRLVTP